MDQWDPWIGKKFDAEIEEHNKHDGNQLVAVALKHGQGILG